MVEDALDLREEQRTHLDDARVLPPVRVERAPRSVGVPEQQAADCPSRGHRDRTARLLEAVGRPVLRTEDVDRPQAGDRFDQVFERVAGAGVGASPVDLPAMVEPSRREPSSPHYDLDPAHRAARHAEDAVATKRVETRPLHGRAHDQYEDGAHGNESGEEQCPAQSLPPVAP